MDTFTSDMSIILQAAIQVVWNFSPAIAGAIIYGVYDAVRDMNTWRI